MAGELWAPYMRWAKTRPVPHYDLAGSNLLHCDWTDLPGALEDLPLNGSNPDGHPQLIEAIARRYGTTADRVATAPGAAGANFHAFAAVVRPGDDVLVERPAYDPLLGALRLLGAKIRRFDRAFEGGWGVDPERVAAALTKRTRLVVISSPHNPSGALVTAEALDGIAAAVARVGAHVLVDEVYLDSVYQGNPGPAAVRSDVFISTSSLTKSYGLSALRCGWILGSPGIIEAARRVRDVVDGNSPFATDHLALLAFRYIDRLEARARALLGANMQTLVTFMDGEERLEWVRPAGGTVAFPRVRGVSDTAAIADRLMREHGTAVVPGAFFEEPSHLRIAFGCAPQTLAAGLDALSRVLRDHT